MGTFFRDTYKLGFRKVYRVTSGVIAGGFQSTTDFNYFENTAQVDDALYFCASNRCGLADFQFNVGTALVATDIELAWEYYTRDDVWVAIEDLVDETNGFTNLGANEVRFPLQWRPHYTYLGGSVDGNQYWIRCRIVSVTGLTNGGANTGSTVGFFYGSYISSGFTEAVPGTFDELYDYIKANHPHIGVQKVGSNTFDFTKIGVFFYSYMATKNEVFITGQNITRSSIAQTYNKFSHLVCGEELGGRGINGSVFIVYGCGNSNSCTFDAYTKLYGSTFRTGQDQKSVPQLPGYANCETVLDCWLELAIRTPSTSGIFAYTTLTSSLLIASAMNNFNDVTLIQIGGRMFYVYTTGWTIKGFDWIHQYAGSMQIFYPYQAGGDYEQEWIVLDPKKELPTLAGMVTEGRTAYPVSISSWSPNLITGYKYFDGTNYTDYTAEAQAQAGVPITGNVGDSFLFGLGNYWIPSYGFGIRINCNTQANDYEYVFEVYDGTTWNLVNEDSVFSSAENFTINHGEVFVAVPSLTPFVEIDGITAKWFRARIVTKGTTTNELLGVRQKRNGGVSRWSVQERYSVNLKVTDSDGVPIDGAEVIGTDENGGILFSVSTGANGKIAEQTVLNKKFFFDPSNTGSYWTQYTGEYLPETFSIQANCNTYINAGLKNISTLGTKDLLIELKPSPILGQGRIS